VVVEKKVVKPKIKQSDLPSLDAIKDELARRNDDDFCRFYIKVIDKKGNEVFLTYNSIQKIIDDKIKELETLGIPARIIVLKARQEGVSTYTQGKLICRLTKNKNRNALVVAHRDDSTNAIFEKAKFMYSKLPDRIKPLQKASNARELIFDLPATHKGKGEGLNSRFKLLVAMESDAQIPITMFIFRSLLSMVEILQLLFLGYYNQFPIYRER